MNIMKELKPILIPAVLVMLFLIFGTPTLSLWFGPALGQATSYIVTLLIVIVALWFARKAKMDKALG